MSTNELKIDLIQQINSIDNEVRLKELLQLLEFQNETSIYLTDAEEKKAILEGFENINTGKTLSHEEVQKEIGKCLNR